MLRRIKSCREIKQSYSAIPSCTFLTVQISPYSKALTRLFKTKPPQFCFRVHVCALFEIPAAAASRGRRPCRGTSGGSGCWGGSDPWGSATSCCSSSASSQPWPIYTMRRSSRKETSSPRASSSRTVNCKGEDGGGVGREKALGCAEIFKTDLGSRLHVCFYFFYFCIFFFADMSLASCSTV